MLQPRNVRRRDARIAYYERCAACTNRRERADATRRIRPPASRPEDAALAAVHNRANEGADLDAGTHDPGDECILDTAHGGPDGEDVVNGR